MAVKIIFFVVLITTHSHLMAETVVFSVGSKTSHRKDLVPLNFTKQDTTRFNQAMEQVGLVQKANIYTLNSPTSRVFEDKFKQLVDKYSKDAHLDKFIFYYSGHADETGLHFKDSSLDKDTIHNLIKGVHAKTKVAFFDSCFSGTLLNKGVKIKQGFKIPKMSYSEPTGSIFLSATSSNDYAYESSRIQGSLFTKNIISGLYGAGDGNNDGVVTASELYVHAYQNTKIDSHLYPISNPQVPEFSSNLRGQGAVALSFPKKASGSILLDNDIQGKLELYADNGLGFYKYNKKESNQLKINLPASKYKILKKSGHKIQYSPIEVTQDHTTFIASSNFKNISSNSLNSAVKGYQGEETSNSNTDFILNLDGTIGQDVGDLFLGLELIVPVSSHFYFSHEVAHSVSPLGIRLSEGLGYQLKWKSFKLSVLSKIFLWFDYGSGVSYGFSPRLVTTFFNLPTSFHLGAHFEYGHRNTRPQSVGLNFGVGYKI